MPRARIQITPQHSADLFTDRVTESEALARSLTSHRCALDSNTGDSADAARNVLVYHGVGGIGKTTLSRRLQSWVIGDLPDPGDWGAAPDVTVDATARLDLHGSHGSVDITAMTIALRRSLNDVKNSWPAFDWAFAAWWAAAHPDEPLPGAGENRDNGLTAAISDTLAAVLSDLGALNTAVGVGFGALRLAARQFAKARNRQAAHAIVGDSDYFKELLGRCADVPTPSDPHPELLIEIVNLLALEFDSMRPCPMVVVFVDTFEHIQITRDHARNGEALINRMIYSLPHVLFVITGRNRLDWADLNDDGRTIKRRALEAGPAIWPGLVKGTTEDPRQHLVGNLSREDASALIMGLRATHGLHISDEIVAALVEASHGMPHYLDLASEVALKIKRNGGGDVTLADVTGSLGDLVERVMDGIPADEQRALRGATLFSQFDPELVAAAGNVDVGCAKRALESSMIEIWTDADLPYRMHETIRRAIRRAGHSVAHGWAETDWRQAAQRALDELRRRVDTATKDERHVDRLRATGLAITLVCEEPVEAKSIDTPNGDWLQQAVLNGASVPGLRPHVPSDRSTPDGRIFTKYGSGFIDYIDAVTARTSTTSIDNAAELLRRIADFDHPLAPSARRQLAYSLREAEKHEDSVEVWGEAIANDPSELNRYQRRLTLIYARRFRDALDGVSELSDARQHRLRAHVEYFHGEPQRSIDVANVRSVARHAAGSIREAYEAKGEWAYKQAFFVAPPSSDYLGDLINHGREVGYTDAVRYGLRAMIFCDPRNSKASEWLAEMRRFRATEVVGPSAEELWAETCIAWATGDNDLLASLAREVDEWPGSKAAWIPLEILLNHLGFQVKPQPAQWLEPDSVVHERWILHWKTWHTRVVG